MGLNIGYGKNTGLYFREYKGQWKRGNTIIFSYLSTNGWPLKGPFCVGIRLRQDQILVGGLGGLQ